MDEFKDNFDVDGDGDDSSDSFDFDDDGEDYSESEWAELEHMPLKQRLILLLEQRGITVDMLLKSEAQLPDSSTNVSGAVPEKNVSELCGSQSGCTAHEEMSATVLKEERDIGEHGELIKQENIVPNCRILSDTTTAVDTSEKVDSVDGDSVHESFSEEYPVTVKVECADVHDEKPSVDLIGCSSTSDIQKVNHEPEDNFDVDGEGDDSSDNFDLDDDGEDYSESEWAELEHMPLKQRLILLLAQRGITVDMLLKSEAQLPDSSINVSEVVPEKNGSELCGSQHLQSVCTAQEEMSATVLKGERDTGELGELRKQENAAPNCRILCDAITAADTSEKVDSVDSNSLQESFSEGYPVTVKVERSDIHDENPSVDLIGCSSESDIQKVNYEPEMTAECADELDNVVLKERLRRFLISKSGLASRTPQENSGGTDKEELIFGDQTLAVRGNERIFEPGLPKDAANPSDETFQERGPLSVGNKSTCLGSLGIQRSDMTSEEKCFNIESNAGKPLLYCVTKNVQSSEIPSSAKIKTEPTNFDEVQSSNVTIAGKMSMENFVGVKTEAKFADSFEDYLDHMLLRDRMKLLSSKDNHILNNRQNSECLSEKIPSPLRCRPFASMPAQPVKIDRPRKKRRTVTDSVATAIEEDAPGLLRVLIDQGVSVNEIKLYGEPEINDALDDSSTKDNFAELENVITKLFSQRESFLKLGPLRRMKAEKASYCLECLFSLVEQARYLQFRSWPVEWGWCRDLRSFLFVFERHNRIVLERPEYGFATYFFELADSLPIDWQIKRLVTAMKLTSCSRITLIENKALVVGDDLTEGEARVLMEYGWIPNTGLGTMLNYYDRVVHDRKSEKNSSEWRSKIRKLLMDGYNGGTIVPAGIPKKAMDYDAEQPMQIKLELD